MTETTNAERDAATLRMLGWFFVALGLLVLVGTFWTLGDPRAMLVNLGSGLVLGGVGVGMLVASRRLSAKTDATNSI